MLSTQAHGSLQTTLQAVMNQAAPGIKADLVAFLNSDKQKAESCAKKIVELGAQIARLDRDNAETHMQTFYQATIFPIVKQYAIQITENKIGDLSNENVAYNLDFFGSAKKAQEVTLIHLEAAANNNFTALSIFKTAVFKLYQMTEFIINPNRTPSEQSAPVINLLNLFKKNCYDIPLYRAIDPAMSLSI